MDLAWSQPIAELLERETGIVFAGQRRDLLNSRTQECARALGLASPKELYQRLSSEGTAGDAMRFLIDSIITDESSWFRYAEHFEILRDFVLPAIASNKSFSGESNIRILSAGCARGQEPYSIAMLASDHPEALEHCALSLVAVDISHANIGYAREATYSLPEMRGLSSGQVERFFTPLRKDSLRLVPELRSRVQFARMNLLEQTPSGPFDIIFCRNVVIYFEAEVARRVMRSLLQTLRPGGYLFIGHAESCNGLDDELRLIQVGRGFVYRRTLTGAAPLPGWRSSREAS